MLVLSRKKGEKLIATLPSGELVKITVLNVKGQDVRIGIEAPQNIVVDREEIHLRKVADSKSA